MPEKKVTDVDELPIGYIAEELWIYSKSVELLTEPEDACYLAAQTQDIQLNITEMLCLLKNKLPVKDVDWLIEICDNVFSGEKFDDIMFNNVRLIQCVMHIYKSISANYVFIEKRLFQVGNALMRWHISAKSIFFCVQN